MALPNLSGSNIQDTFQRVLQTDGALVYDGSGSALPISFVSGTLNVPDGNLILGNSNAFIKAYGGEPWLSISGPGPASRITYVSTQLKISDEKGISFGSDAHFRIESEEGPDKLTFKTFDHGDFSPTVKLEMDKGGNLTSSANFSSSGVITANAFVGNGSGITGVTGEWDGTHTGTATFTGDITASGDISSSGIITATSFVGNMDGGTF